MKIFVEVAGKTIKEKVFEVAGKIAVGVVCEVTVWYVSRKIIKNIEKIQKEENNKETTEE